MSSRARVRVGVTMGDPAGIGPEIVLKAITDPRVREVCEPVPYGPRTAAERKRFTPGVLSADAGRAACEAIETFVTSPHGDPRAALLALFDATGLRYHLDGDSVIIDP